MDELGRILDRVAAGQTEHVLVPAPSAIVELARRRAMLRLLTSSAVVVLMAAAFVLVLAGVGLASSEITHPVRPLAAPSAEVR